MVVRAAGMAVGAAGVRAALADAFCDALNAGFTPTVHRIGSVGQADLSQLAEIGCALIGEGPDGTRLAEHGLAPLVLEAREAHAIVNSNAFSTGVACIGLERARAALAALEVSAALSYEGDRRQRQPDPPATSIASVPTTAIAVPPRTCARCWPAARSPPERRRLACSRTSCRSRRSARCRGRRATRWRSSATSCSSSSRERRQPDHDPRRGSGDLDRQPRRDRARSRARLRPARRRERGDGRGGAGAEAPHAAFQRPLERASRRPGGPGRRSQHDWRRRHRGARRRDPTARRADDARAPTSGVAEGIEDRISLAPVGAARLVEQAALVLRLAAIELVCAAQAVDLRGRTGELAPGTLGAYEATRRRVPFMAAGQAPSGDLEALAEWVGEQEAAASIALTLPPSSIARRLLGSPPPTARSARRSAQSERAPRQRSSTSPRSTAAVPARRSCCGATRHPRAG